MSDTVKYWIGDPCYCFSKPDWKEYVKDIENPHDISDNEHRRFWNGFEIFEVYTGDGRFFDNDGREYGVDSGSIAIIPWEYISTFHDADKYSLGSPVLGWCHEMKRLEGIEVTDSEIIIGEELRINIADAPDDDDSDTEYGRLTIANLLLSWGRRLRRFVRRTIGSDERPAV